jgi:hypothetical protein
MVACLLQATSSIDMNVFGPPGSIGATLASFIAPLALFIVSLAFLGTLQMFALGHIIGRTAWWVPATVIGFALGLLALGAVFGAGVGILGGDNSPFIVAPLVIGSMVCGLIAGTAQWAVLRRKSAHAGWWIPFNAAAVSAAVPLFVTLSRANDVGTAAAIAAAVAAGSVYGMISGVPLIWLSRSSNSLNHRSKNQSS